MHKPKKSLGQNFLKSKSALKKIISAGEITPKDVILEIGPGKGVLTEEILKCVNPAKEGRGKVIAVEKDSALFEFLKKKFEKEIKLGSLVLIHDDILGFKVESYKVESYKVIANIPYNITGAILKKFLTAKHQPERMVLLVQHEVAKRIVARDSKESILSISVKAYGEPKIVGKVEARYFSPQPKVDSAIISIKNISRKFFVENNLGEERFWEIVKKGFAHKRKKLSSNLRGVCQGSTLTWLGDRRAEDLKLVDWVSLVKG